MITETLVDTEVYLKAGAHIGTKFKSGDMRKYIYKVRHKDNLNVLNVSTIDERIASAAKFLARFDAERIAVVSRKLYGQTPAEVFSETIGAKMYKGRFVPGTFTNPASRKYFEPKVILVTEPDSDFQAISEASIVKVPVIGICSTNNPTRNIDVVIPINNKGRKSLALVFWLLAREVLKARGDIKGNEDFKKNVEDFEYQIKEGERDEDEYSKQRARFKSQQRGAKGRQGGNRRR